MRKTLLFCTFLVSIVFLFTQCNEDDITTEHVYNEVARFAEGDPVLVVPENSEDIIDVPVYLNYHSEEPVEVKYEITGDMGAFEMVSEYGVAVVPAGRRKGRILLKPVDNFDINDPDQSITIKIMDGTGGYVEQDDVVPIGNAVKIIRFADNECPIAISRTYTGDVTALGGTAPTYTATLTPVDGTDNQYKIDSSWGPDFVAWATGNADYSGQYIYSGVITINANNSVTLAGDDSWATGGSGTFIPDPAGKFEITLTQDLFTQAFPVNVVLTGNCD